MLNQRFTLVSQIPAAVWKQSELSGHLATIKGLKDARRGNLPGVHLLATSDFAGTVSEILVCGSRW